MSANHATKQHLIQERLNAKRAPLDQWSIQEQLCLASAVACSGDQNWMSVSRALKGIVSSFSSRPADWFTAKSCATQYGRLLESVETPKRKKVSTFEWLESFYNINCIYFSALHQKEINQLKHRQRLSNPWSKNLQPKE